MEDISSGVMTAAAELRRMFHEGREPTIDDNYGLFWEPIQFIHTVYQSELSTARLLVTAGRSTDDPHRTALQCAMSEFVDRMRSQMYQENPVWMALTEEFLRSEPIMSDGRPCCPHHPTRFLKFKDGNWRCGKSLGNGRFCDFSWIGLGHDIPDPNQQATPSTTDVQIAPVEKSHFQSIIGLDELQKLHLDPPEWIIERILPVGVCILAAKPKMRKSFLMLSISLAIANGGKALGCLEVKRGGVLYIDLDSRKWRIRARVSQMLQKGDPWPSNFQVVDTWSNGDEAIQDLRYYLMTHPETKLVVIDVIADFRRPINRFEQPYNYDRDTIKPLNDLGEEFRCAIVLVHHVNKARWDDIMDSISGTTGLRSASNTQWVLGKAPDDITRAAMAIDGRDIEDKEPMSLKWDDYLTQYILEGSATELFTSTGRKEILMVLGDGIPRTPTQIAQELGKSAANVKRQLRFLLDENLVEKVGYGNYAAIVQKPTIPPSPNSDYEESARTLVDRLRSRNAAR